MIRTDTIQSVTQAPGTCAASFRCAACGAVAAEICLVLVGTPFDFGPPIGDQTKARDGVTVSAFLGTHWKAIDLARRDQVSKALAADPANPAALHAIDWELASFWCRTCQSS